MKNKVKGFYTVTDIAKHCNKSVSFIRFLTYRGKLPFYTVGGHTLFKGSDLEYIEFFFKNIQKGVRGRPRLKKEVVDVK